MLWLRFWVAGLAMRFCGPEHLYWTAADEWEEYMSQGQPRPTWTPVPQAIFQDIQALADINPYSQTARRVMDWLYSQQVEIEDAK